METILTGAPKKPRVAFIDAARGTAMLAVFFAHFVAAYEAVFKPGESRVLDYLHWATLTASPAFVAISGVMLGLLYERNRERWGPMRDRFVDRGLTLLVVGHALIGTAVAIRSGIDLGFRRIFITDTIGLSLIVGATVIVRLTPWRRILVGLGCLATSWLVPFFWHPEAGHLAWRLEDVVFGEGVWLANNFPPLVWFGVFVVGSAAGDTVGRLGQAQPRRLAREAARLGFVFVSVALAMKVVFHALARLRPLATHATRLNYFGSITGKFPPSPTYLLFYGGLALLLFTLVLAWADTPFGAFANRWTALFGRTALVSFLAQFYVYYVGVTFLPHPRGAWIAVYFLFTVFLLRQFARLWDRHNCNRWFTVGYPALAAAFREYRERVQTVAEISQVN
jgi:uncharacterized membrane protein